MERDRQKLRLLSRMVAFALIAYSLPLAMAATGYYQKLWILLGVLALFVVSGIRILNEDDRGVVFRLGRFSGVKTAGLKWIIPVVDRMVRISLRETEMEVPTQEVITRDDVSAKVNAALYFRVVHPEQAVIQVENYLHGTAQMLQATVRSVCSQVEYNKLFSNRGRINRQLCIEINDHLEPWGIKVRAVEVKQIDRG